MQIQQGFSSFFSSKFCLIWWFFRREYCETLKKSSNMGRRNIEKHCSILFQFWVFTIKPDFGHIHLLARSFTIQRTKPHYFYDLKKALTSQPNLKLGSEIILLDIVPIYLAIHYSVQNIYRLTWTDISLQVTANCKLHLEIWKTIGKASALKVYKLRKYNLKFSYLE